MFSCNLCCRLIFLHGRSRTYRVASLRAGPVGCISYNLYFDCKHVRYVTCDLINEYTLQTNVGAAEENNNTNKNIKRSFFNMKQVNQHKYYTIILKICYIN